MEKILLLATSTAILVLVYIMHSRVEPCRTYLMDNGNGTPARLVIDCGER